jgi:hypothetical protein
MNQDEIHTFLSIPEFFFDYSNKSKYPTEKFFNYLQTQTE